MSADMKKPPVAPKPKLVLGQKPSPPPLAPKPDLVLLNMVQACKKSKPAIAPKPKVVQGSSLEEKPQSLVKPSINNFEEHKGNGFGNVPCTKETPNDTVSSAYIISPCTCTFDCHHKLGNEEHLHRTQKVLERQENLENKKMCGQPPPCVRTRRKQGSQLVKLPKGNQVLLKASILEDKVSNLLTPSVLSNGGIYKHKSTNKDIKPYGNGKGKIDSKCSEGYFSTTDGFACNLNKDRKLDIDVSPPPLAYGGYVYHSDSEKMDSDKQRNGKLSDTNDNEALGPPQRAPPPQKVLPVPKPRRSRTQCLVRQDCIERSTEGTDDPVTLDVGSQSPSKHGINGIHSSKTHREFEKCNSNISDSKEISTISHTNENGDVYTESVIHDTFSENPSESLMEETNSFKRYSSLSMSLPKQLKLMYEQSLPIKKSCDVTADKINAVAENSPKVAPKKPQRHSLIAATLLKKAASEENLHDCSENESPQGSSESTYHRHLSAIGQCLSSSLNIPKSSLEKAAWKLPHPILPLSGRPESLKVSSSNENLNAITKPRAKSLSSVDMERIDKPAKDSTKKSPLRKLLNMKLSVCIIKSDFQKFLSRGCHSSDSTRCDVLSYKETPASPALDRKAKAHSADCYSPSSAKKWQIHRNDSNVLNNHVAQSEDQELLNRNKPVQTPTIDLSYHDLPAYENICHYEEIPEYENLPHTLVLDESDATIYEVEDPAEATIALHSHIYHRESYQEDPEDELGIVHSDDEDISNSSEEDEFSSDSSKGEVDHPEYKPKKKRTKRKSKVYHIAKEIMTSEKVFVDVLKLLHVDFRNAVAQASRHLGKSVIEEKILNQILYYLPQLYELNRDVLRELEERMSQWSEHQKIADIFVKKGPYLKMYSTYIREFDRNMSLLDEQCRKNPVFAGIVRDFEMTPRSANLALKHYLLKPVQRIPQYRLLLTDYLKNLSEDSSDYSDTQAALTVVIEVANHANDILKQGDNFQKLMQIQYSLNGHHEIVQPGRVFLKEGTLMKLSRKVMQPRMFFLFNDALLYTTPVQSGMYKLNNMLSLAGMKVRKPTQEAYQNELNIESVERSFILSASSATERDDWLDAISEAIEEYAKKKITFNPAKSLEEADPEENSDCVLGSKAPIWIPDGRVTMCMICTSEFTLTWRRHHCRACGKIICQACSANKHSLEYMKKHLARVCDHCFQELQKQDNLSAPKTASPANHKSPSSALSSVLHSIPSGRKQKKIPAALKVSASTEDSSMSGYLHRSKGSKKPWKQLWFVIKNKVLYTYAASEDIAALESQPLLGFTIKVVKDETSECNVIHLLHKNTLFYVFKADDAHTTQRWIEAFQEGTVL
ncbi:FYVE, RhoGEF and PH domain-containing protein 6 [Spea bombifrons]|uniref:FYVE, RhoGEF and PH domain-containing protein 6 n=1 Tax=Spea bombifrons TaxID=233779 RepID=UPI00234A284D|nr:FYVE, RhoGEF and PH domain-containing protein 6 [Spea bombifrons]